MLHVLIINGPNLNLLGTREPSLYGKSSITEIEASLRSELSSSEQLTFVQSNHEGELVDYIQSARNQAVDAIIINAAAYTHTSIAIRDALLAVQLPFIELHLSNTHKRESFRHLSYLSDIAEGIIMGLGATGYSLALRAALELADRHKLSSPIS